MREKISQYKLTSNDNYDVTCLRYLIILSRIIKVKQSFSIFNLIKTWGKETNMKNKFY